jgi:hypothetical protein
LAAAASTCPGSARAQTAPERPFGTLREQAALQQDWLVKRLDRFLPVLMRKYGIDLWVVPMREYNEDPVFAAITAPQTFAARRRTIYVFFDKCAASGQPPAAACVERIALGGTSQGGVFEVLRSSKPVTGDARQGRQAELWGDEQWQALLAVVEGRNPTVIGIDRSTVFAFSDGLTAGELMGMSQALGGKWTARFKNAEGLPLDLIASRLPEEEAFYQRLQELVWSLTQEMFSSRVVSPGKTRTSDLVWWWRQRVNDLGLGTWFHPSVDVQRRGATSTGLGDDPVIERGTSCTRRRHHRGAAQCGLNAAHGVRAAVGEPTRRGPRRALRTRISGHRIDEPGSAAPAADSPPAPLASRRRRRASTADLLAPIGLHATAPPAHRPLDYQDVAKRGAPVIRACGGRSSCRRRRRSRSGAASRSGWRRRRTRSSTPRGAYAGRSAGRTSCSSFADRPRAAVARGVVARLLALVVGGRPT